MKQRSRKSSRKEALISPIPTVGVTVGRVAVNVGEEFRQLMVRGGLALAGALFEDEVNKLCGPRYARGEHLANRWGSAQGEATLGGRKVSLVHPRVRRGKHEVELDTYAQLRAEDPLLLTTLGRDRPAVSGQAA
jgi:hypothetical protein